MNDRALRQMFSKLNDRIEKGLLSGHTFVGDKGQITTRILKFYGGEFERPIEFSQASDGKEQQLIIKVDNSSKKVRKTVRIWKILDREEKPKKHLGYLACIDPEGLYTSWEKQSDLAIRETVEMALLAYNRKQGILRQGISAAVAAIMSRNMSHNIGSHVLSYIVNEYALHDKGDLAKQLRKVIEDDIVGSIVNQVLDWKNESHSNEKIKTSIPNLMKRKRGIDDFIQNNRYLLKYLKDRMDFIATVLTYVPSCTTMDFARDFIGRETVENESQKSPESINFDAKLRTRMTHGKPENSFFGDMNLLLNYICFSEKIGGHNITREKIHISLDPYRFPIPVAIPGGAIGKQAFYTIVENIVRNCAKHGARFLVGEDCLKFGIQLPDVEMIDTTADSADCQNYEYDRNDLLRVSITDNVGNATSDSDDVRRLREALEEEIVDGKGNLVRENLGLKEMKVAAAFLRGVDPRDIIGNEIRQNGSAARKLIAVNKHSGSDCLEFSFFLLKPKQILIVTGTDSNLPLKGKFREYGIDIIKQGTPEYKKSLEECEKNKLRYRFIVYCTEKKPAKPNEDFLPRRTLFTTAEEIEVVENPDQLLKDVYKKWIKQQYNLEKMPVFFLSGEFFDIWKSKELNEDVIKWPGCWKDLEDSKSKMIYLTHFEEDYPKLEKELNCSPNFIHEKKILSVDSITGANSTKQRIVDPVDTELLRLELIESALTKVLIIDERLYEAASRRTPEVLELKGIDVWDLDVESDGKLVFNTLSSKNDVRISIIGSQVNIRGCARKYDFLAIHQGIIDKIMERCSENAKQPEERCLETILGSLEQLASFFIIHSGRGKTKPVRQGWRFMGYSELESWFMSDDKYEIVQGLYSIVGR